LQQALGAGLLTHDESRRAEANPLRGHQCRPYAGHPSREHRAPRDRLREEQLLTKAELARKAGVSPLTISRIEAGLECRVDTKRKIIYALGLTPTDRAKVFGGRRRG